GALDASAVESLFLKVRDHFVAIFRFELPYLRPLQHRAVRIRQRRETTSTLQHGAEPFILLNAVAAGMHDLAVPGNGAADIVPATDLADGQDVAGFESNVGIGLAGERASDGHGPMLQIHVISLDYRIAREIGPILESATFESTGQAKEVGGAHA